ncbi:MAG: HAL/PAL/TAL family ammonia-lyase [Myxococcota bacterium]
MQHLSINGHDLKLKNIISVARQRQRVELSPKSIKLTARCRSVVDILVQNNIPVYGLTTGFGSKRNVFIDREDTKTLQHNLIMSHASGIGTPLPEDVIRAALLLRANALARGHSGIRTILLEKIIELLNLDIFPWVPDQGSVSASGDLAPLSHIALVLVGDPGGKIYNPEKMNRTDNSDYVEAPLKKDFIPSTAENLKKYYGYEPVQLEAKEGLALTNGVQVTCAMGLINAWDAISLVKHADLSCSLSLEALKGIPAAFDGAIARARPYRGQTESASNIRELIENSFVLSIPLNSAILTRAQNLISDSLSLVSDSQNIKKIKQIRAQLTEILKDPMSSLAVMEEQEEVQKGFFSAGDSQTLALREKIKPIQIQVQKLIQQILAPGEETPKISHLRENLVIISEMLEKAVPKIPSVQNDYSFRCASQVHGAVRNTLQHVIELLLIEANSSTDNPLIFPPDGPEDLKAYKASLSIEKCRNAVLSGGNFHGEPIALPMDYLTLAVSELGSISERRIAKIIDGKHNNGLPSLLINKSGLNSGFMIPQYTAASLVSENKSLVYPASADSIPTCENTEDHVSMGLIAARKTRTVLKNTTKIIAIELLVAFQGLHYRKPFLSKLGKGTQKIFNEMQNTDGIEFVEKDRILAPLISRVLELVENRTLLNKIQYLD